MVWHCRAIKSTRHRKPIQRPTATNIKNRIEATTMMHPVHVTVYFAILLLLSNANFFSHAADSSCTDQQPHEVGSCTAEDSSPLALAHKLKAPLATDTKDAEFEDDAFWEANGPLLQKAWEEWEGISAAAAPMSSSNNDDFINPTLSMALDNCVNDPSDETEAAVKALWTNSKNDNQPLPKGVYATQLLDSSGIQLIRKLLDSATSSGIPTRRPNGMNRHGVIIDSEVYGAVSVKPLVKLVEEELINRVARPVGRMLFPDRIGCDDDIEYFAFTIRYDGSDDDADAGGNDNESSQQHDTELREHRDASVVTLNINLNLPNPNESDYSGSEVFFREYPSEETNDVTKDNYEQVTPGDDATNFGGTLRFSPGMAIIHLGAHRHGARPISASAGKSGSGRRYNLVIWLFGKDGDVRIAPYVKEEQMNVVERWLGCNATEDLFL